MLKTSLSLAMLFVLGMGVMQYTDAGACEDACQASYNNQMANCYSITDPSFRALCIDNAQDKRTTCLNECATAPSCEDDCYTAYQNRLSNCYAITHSMWRQLCLNNAQSQYSICLSGC